MTDEIELKLTLPPGSAASVTRRPAFKRLIGQQTSDHVKRQRLDSVYFDTTEKWLSERGMALRVRRIGKKRIQTLKAPLGGPDGLQSYREYETEIKGQQPLLAAVADSGLRARLGRAKVWDRLQPVFNTRFDRSSFLVERNGSSIEVAVDHGEINAAAKRRPIAEIELELKSGDAANLFDLAASLVEELAEETPIRLGHETKAARGFALAEGALPRPHKAAPIVLDPDATTAEAFVAIARNCLAQLRANEAAVLAVEGDEAIHQFRVAVRRLRAVVGAYRDLIDDDVHAMLSIDLRWLQRQFGPARDLDVLIAETLTPLNQCLHRQLPLNPLIAAAEAARVEARREAHLALENPRYAALLIELYRRLHGSNWQRLSAGARLGAPARNFASTLLQARHKRLIKLGGRSAGLPETELHRLRLMGKKMRYASEAFASLYKAKPARKYVTALAAIQDRLGSLNDAFVSRSVLTQLVQRLTREQGMPAADAALLHGTVLGWQTARIERDLADFPDAWRDFAKCKRFWAAN